MNLRSPGQEMDGPILQFQDVDFGSTKENAIRLNRFSTALNAGELIQIHLDNRLDPGDLVLMILGLAFPEAGKIQFDGQDWYGTDYSRHFQMRSRIGRVFSGAAWIQSLTVGENIRLSQLHHGKLLPEIQESIGQWTKRLSGGRMAAVLRSLKKRPAYVEAPILQICQLIRALSFHPLLLLLEMPLRYLPEELHATLISVIDEFREQGTSILWFTRNREDHELQFEKPIVAWRVVEGELKLSEVQSCHE